MIGEEADIYGVTMTHQNTRSKVAQEVYQTHSTAGLLKTSVLPSSIDFLVRFGLGAAATIS